MLYKSFVKEQNAFTDILMAGNYAYLVFSAFSMFQWGIIRENGDGIQI